MSSEPKPAGKGADGEWPWASLVPEIYYDLIARVPAGMLVVVGLLWLETPVAVLTVFLKAPLGASVVVGSLILLLLASFTAGLLLSAYGDLLTDRVRAREWGGRERKIAPSRYGEGSPRLVSREREAFDYLREAKPEISRVMVKMRAEASLPGNVLAACLVLALVAVWAAPWRPRVVAFLFLSAAFCVHAALHRNRKYVDSLLTYCEGERTGDQSGVARFLAVAPFLVAGLWLVAAVFVLGWGRAPFGHPRWLTAPLILGPAVLWWSTGGPRQQGPSGKSEAGVATTGETKS